MFTQCLPSAAFQCDFEGECRGAGDSLTSMSTVQIWRGENRGGDSLLIAADGIWSAIYKFVRTDDR